METEGNGQDFLQFANKIGYDIGENMEQNIDMHFQKNFDFLPDFALFIASYKVKKTFSRQTTPPKQIQNSIRFFFHNVFDDEPTNGKGKLKTPEKPPYVRIFPSELPHTSIFRKNWHVKVVSVFISADYLKSFLNDDVEHFPFLFDNGNQFLIEEMMTDDILRTINDIVKKEEPTGLNSYYYKLKTIELLFYLFQSLNKREKSVHQKLNSKDIKAIYSVRDTLISSLDKPVPIAQLKQVAGMNELKMRQLFTQVFGMGIYDYYQNVRMKEAARLLRDEKLSVSEVGYQMGFENLSHFSRVFEKNIGKKPKKYSKELM
ncbi:helix-turn-helix domain-containing protein [Chryseobacterium paridis]|uniref:Helix-turn-helix transcriptional regulator n=1 Tax=Chryseobacterium paridis TaxID=2800328 RepID=A0ABS1FUM9_9FLAO|nr:AraC family transcriptional regulator [Chryseobacterium paridis]MBK1896155.1 helix-turn-helix transcriptional regulator [Chryseobacterium paridis]